MHFKSDDFSKIKNLFQSTLPKSAFIIGHQPNEERAHQEHSQSRELFYVRLQNYKLQVATWNLLKLTVNLRI